MELSIIVVIVLLILIAPSYFVALAIIPLILFLLALRMPVKKDQKKDLNYYLNLPYDIEITTIPDDEGGVCFARLSLSGTLDVNIIGHGATHYEALIDLKKNTKERFQYYLDEGIDIPEPLNPKQKRKDS